MTQCLDEGSLRAYMDSALSHEEHETAASHLAGCGHCREKLAQVRASALQVGALMPHPTVAPDAQFALARLLTTGAQPGSQTPTSFSARTARAKPWTHMFGQGRTRVAAAGFALGLAVVLVLGLSSYLGSPQVSTPGSVALMPMPKGESFVPPGKVRHITIVHTYTRQGQTEGSFNGSFTEEVWLANGKSHLLMKNTSSLSSTTWIEEDAVYKYNPQLTPQRDDTVYKYPYAPQELALYVPNDFGYLMTLPNARVMGDDTLDGRAVTVIESFGDKGTATPQPNWEERSVRDYKLWVDKETFQVLQRRHTTTFTAGRRNGTVETQTFRVSANELEDASQYPTGFFSFVLPEGAKVVEAPSPFIGASLNLPAPVPTPLVGQGGDPNTNPEAPGSKSVKVGDVAPDFEVQNVQTGQPIKLSSLQGKPVALTFWGTWCPPCRTILPTMQDSYAKWQGKVEFLSVSLGPHDTVEAVKSFVNQNGYAWTFAHGPMAYLSDTPTCCAYDPDSEVSGPYDIHAIPITYFIDKDGVVRATHLGPPSAEQLEEYLSKIQP